MSKNYKAGEMVKDIALQLTKINNDYISFYILLLAKVETLSCGDPWPQAEQELIAEQYQHTLFSLQNHTNIKSTIMLLRDDDLAEIYQQYLDLVGYVISSYSQDKSLTLNELNEISARSSKSYD